MLSSIEQKMSSLQACVLEIDLAILNYFIVLVDEPATYFMLFVWGKQGKHRNSSSGVLRYNYMDNIR